jgi:hypothetical protein
VSLNRRRIEQTTIKLGPGESLNVEISASEDFRQPVPEISNALIECSNFINERYVEDGKSPLLYLVFL